jgi:hydroxymethylglutaryl-CoA reductase (NADPH)
VQVRRIKEMRQAAKFGVPLPKANTTGAVHPRIEGLTIAQKWSAAVLGVKGALLHSKVDAKGEGQKPAMKIKLALVCGRFLMGAPRRIYLLTVYSSLTQIVTFLGLHVLNFSSALTSDTALARYNTHSASVIENDRLTQKVDIASPAVAEVLASLAAAHAASPAADAPLLVKLAPPVHVRVGSTVATAAAPPAASSPLAATTAKMSAVGTPASGVEYLMEAVTRLVGDPVLSKWIVGLLAVSVALNGYLMKGIVVASSTATPRPSPGVRFRALAEEKQVDREASVTSFAASTAVAPIPIRPDNELGLRLDAVDKKLKEAQKLGAGGKQSLPTPSVTPPAERSSPVRLARSDSEGYVKKESVGPVRSLEECIDIFENGPRPVSAALATLTDEEVIMLAQHGKIAAYALEKTLGDLERAVFIRRALICKDFFALLPVLS